MSAVISHSLGNTIRCESLDQLESSFQQAVEAYGQTFTSDQPDVPEHVKKQHLFGNEREGTIVSHGLCAKKNPALLPFEFYPG
ncbi:hypothetical protein I204_08160 [Kwoniella mangroviensis CBS 8886]|nr:hypothetical protein I204_08160 [Kwoniella mangroviensis CBS 8886]